MRMGKRTASFTKLLHVALSRRLGKTLVHSFLALDGFYIILQRTETQSIIGSRASLEIEKQF